MYVYYESTAEDSMGTLWRVKFNKFTVTNNFNCAGSLSITLINNDKGRRLNQKVIMIKKLLEERRMILSANERAQEIQKNRRGKKSFRLRTINIVFCFGLQGGIKEERKLRVGRKSDEAVNVIDRRHKRATDCKRMKGRTNKRRLKLHRLFSAYKARESEIRDKKYSC